MANENSANIATAQAEQYPEPPPDAPDAVPFPPDKKVGIFNGFQNPVVSGTLSREDLKKIHSYIHDPNHGELDDNVIGLLPSTEKNEAKPQPEAGKSTPRTSSSIIVPPFIGM